MIGKIIRKEECIAYNSNKPYIHLIIDDHSKLYRLYDFEMISNKFLEDEKINFTYFKGKNMDSLKTISKREVQ